VWTEGIRLVRVPSAISSRNIFATCSYGGTAESGSITRPSFPRDGTVGKISLDRLPGRGPAGEFPRVS
jgi:hypothetical protein